MASRSMGKSKLDGKEAEIAKLLEKDVSKSSIAKIVDVSRTALLHFIRSRNLDPKAKPARSGQAPAHAAGQSTLVKIEQ